MSRNLLIGSITNYIWDDIAPFFNSYMQTGFKNCDCVMFTGNMSEQTLDKIRACGVTTLPIPEEYLGGRIVIYRFELYKKFLEDNAGKYDMVLTADIRDVIFQRDLFSLSDASKPFLGVATEDGTMDEEYNKRWVVECYGEDVAQSIKNERIICMGTVWGTAREFLGFVTELCNELEHYQALNIPINDQGSANVIISCKKKFADILRLSTNKDGPVLHLGLTDAKDVHIDEQGFVLNGRGETVAVVHQYDRKSAIVKIVLEKYGRDMSMSAKLRMKHPTPGKILRHLSSGDLMRAVWYAIRKRRIHR